MEHIPMMVENAFRPSVFAQAVAAGQVSIAATAVTTTAASTVSRTLTLSDILLWTAMVIVLLLLFAGVAYLVMQASEDRQTALTDSER
jgi:hypothetical protein